MALLSKIQLAEDKKVIGDTTIKSFLFQFKTLAIKFNAAVPLDTAIAFLHLKYFFKSADKKIVNDALEVILFSDPNNGSENGYKISSLYFDNLNNDDFFYTNAQMIIFRALLAWLSIIMLLIFGGFFI